MNVLALEKVREDIRALVRLIDREQQQIYYTEFEDQLGDLEEVELTYHSTVSEDYRARLERYIRLHKDHLTIRKLQTNLPITRHELGELERMLFEGTELGSQEDYIREYGSEYPLGVFIRSLLGLDISAAKEAFALFLNKGNLNAAQIEFINTLVDYFVHKGTIEKKLLFDTPFTDQHDEGVFGLFSRGGGE